MLTQIHSHYVGYPFTCGRTKKMIRLSQIMLDPDHQMRGIKWSYFLCTDFHISAQWSMFPDETCIIIYMMSVYHVLRWTTCLHKHLPGSMVSENMHIYSQLSSPPPRIDLFLWWGRTVTVSLQPVCGFHHIGFSWWQMSERHYNRIALNECRQIEFLPHLLDAAVNGCLLTTVLWRPRWPTRNTVTDR